MRAPEIRTVNTLSPNTIREKASGFRSQASGFALRLFTDHWKLSPLSERREENHVTCTKRTRCVHVCRTIRYSFENIERKSKTDTRTGCRSIRSSGNNRLQMGIWSTAAPYFRFAQCCKSPWYIKGKEYLARRIDKLFTKNANRLLTSICHFGKLSLVTSRVGGHIQLDEKPGSFA